MVEDALYIVFVTTHIAVLMSGILLFDLYKVQCPYDLHE